MLACSQLLFFKVPLPSPPKKHHCIYIHISKQTSKWKNPPLLHLLYFDFTLVLSLSAEEWLSRTVVALLLFICCFFLTILGLGLYCRAIDSHLCRSLGDVAHNAYLNMRYQYYKYTSTKHVKFAWPSVNVWSWFQRRWWAACVCVCRQHCHLPHPSSCWSCM